MPIFVMNSEKLFDGYLELQAKSLGALMKTYNEIGVPSDLHKLRADIEVINKAVYNYVFSALLPDRQKARDMIESQNKQIQEMVPTIERLRKLVVTKKNGNTINPN